MSIVLSKSDISQHLHVLPRAWPDLGFRVYGLWFRVYGLVFSV